MTYLDLKFSKRIDDLKEMEPGMHVGRRIWNVALGLLVASVLSVPLAACGDDDKGGLVAGGAEAAVASSETSDSAVGDDAILDRPIPDSDPRRSTPFCRDYVEWAERPPDERDRDFQVMAERLVEIFPEGRDDPNVRAVLDAAGSYNLWRRFEVMDLTVGGACDRATPSDDWLQYCRDDALGGFVNEATTASAYLLWLGENLTGEATELRGDVALVAQIASWPERGLGRIIQLPAEAPPESVLALDHMRSRYVQYCATPTLPDITELTSDTSPPIPEATPTTWTIGASDTVTPDGGAPPEGEGVPSEATPTTTS